MVMIHKEDKYMALVNCPECKHEVSDLAQSCPHCGAPVIKSSPIAPPKPKIDALGSFLLWANKHPIKALLLAVFIILVLVSTCNNSQKTTSSNVANEVVSEQKETTTQQDFSKMTTPEHLAIVKNVFSAAIYKDPDQQLAEAKKHAAAIDPKEPEYKEAQDLINAKEESINADKQKREAERKQALSKLRLSKDEVRGITWYRHKNSPAYVNSRSDLHLYFGKKDDMVTPLRLVIEYVAEDWLFIKEFIIKADDQTFSIPAGYSMMERDNGYGGIWEWYDQEVTKDDLAMVSAVIASQKAVIRYNGNQYYRDRTITQKEKQALKEILDAYEKVKGTSNN